MAGGMFGGVNFHYPSRLIMTARVTKKREKLEGQTMDIDSSHYYSTSWDVDVYHVVADTYSELISEIDNIPEEDLIWHHRNRELGFESLPHKRNGKWEVKLRTKKIEHDIED